MSWRTCGVAVAVSATACGEPRASRMVPMRRVGLYVPGGLAVVSVLTYRAFSFWLPTVPGVLAYVQLHRTIQAIKATAGDRHLRALTGQDLGEALAKA